MAKNKTDIRVTAVYDGELDATDVFVGLIVQKCHGKGAENILKEHLTKRSGRGYNGGEVQKSRMSGLCG